MESCLKAKTKKLEGRWKFVGGDIGLGSNQELIFDFEQDGDFTHELILDPYFYGNYANDVIIKGEWKWASRNKLDIDMEKHRYG